VDLPGFAMWADSGAQGLVIGVGPGDDNLVEWFGTVRPKADHPDQPNSAPDHVRPKQAFRKLPPLIF
jgi:hypothetical protein